MQAGRTQLTSLASIPSGRAELKQDSALTASGRLALAAAARDSGSGSAEPESEGAIRERPRKDVDGVRLPIAHSEGAARRISSEALDP